MVDISGESLYIEGMMAKYHEQAKEAGVYIISACGWDCIPTEIGISYLKDKFGPNQMHSAESFIKGKPSKSSSRASINHGTLDSIAEMIAHFREIGPMRKKLYSTLFKKPRVEQKYPLKKVYYPMKVAGKGWTAPFISENIGLANISSQWIYETEDEQPTQFFEYIVFPHIIISIMFMIFAAYLFLMCSCSFTRKLITDYPKCFTFGIFSKEGPTRKQLEGLSFATEIVGKGWTAPANAKNPTSPPDRTLTCLISGPDPGYETTSRCMIQSALSIIDESDKIPFTGGVLSPGFAFRRTSIRERLNRHAVTFEIIN